MPILTPCAEAGAAIIKTPPIATAANPIDFISRLPKIAAVRMISENHGAADLFQANDRIEAACGAPAGCTISEYGRIFTTRPRVGQAADHHVEDRREDQPEQGHAQHAEEYGDAD